MSYNYKMNEYKQEKHKFNITNQIIYVWMILDISGTTAKNGTNRGRTKDTGDKPRTRQKNRD